ncbi:MAG: hypothetical protein CMC96_10505 [Flavobacteriales bacterium]|nr:hypothetical protein [Flavobacteriales bacterium]
MIRKVITKKSFMKRLTTLLCAILVSFTIHAQTFLSQNFTTFTNDSLPPLASGWKNIDSLNNPPALDSIWRFDNPNPRPLNAPIAHPAAILDSDYFGPNASQDAYLISPPFDASADSVVILEFDHYYRHAGSTAEVQVFDSLTWQTVATYTASTADPQHEVIDISSIAAGESYVQIRFRYTGSYDWYWIVDNIVVYQPVPEDIRVVSVDSLKNSCNLTTTETITATFENISNDTLNSVPLNYRINGGSIVAETYTGQVLPNDIITYTFNNTADFSAVGSYDIEVFSTVRNDINFFNDTAYGTTVNKPSFSTFPYFEDFENGAGSWSDGGTNSSWELGAPNGTVINSAYSGSNSWVTNLRGNYNNNEESYVVSPCFDFTSLSQPQIKMRIWVESENSWDGAVLQATKDGGQTWQKVGAFGDPNNWYNDNSITGLSNIEPSEEGWTGVVGNNGTGAWVLAEHDLTGLAGEPSVELRIVFGSDGSINTYDGFAFDDVIIQEAPANDAGVISLIQPTTNCGLGTNDTASISIVNYGTASISNFPVYISLNGAPAIVDTVTSTILPGDTITFTFDSTLNLSTPGSYTFRVYSGLSADGNVTNDTIFRTIDNIPVINTLPYNEDFDASAGGWTSYGTNSSWAHGIPAGTNISAAASASNAWVTNLNGDYNNSELSYLESPCFDFSSYSADPILYFSHIFETEPCCDEGWIEYSIDAGVSWTKLIDNGGAQEWYNDLGNQWWDNTSSMGTGVWVNAENSLTGLAGEPSVKIRFVFSSDGSVTEEGFGVDDISIQLPPPYNLKAIQLVSPSSDNGCGYTSADSVRFAFTNIGSAYATNFDLGYIINGASPVTETFADTIFPGDTIVYTFDSTANLSAINTYGFDVFTALGIDIDPTNDTISDSVTHRPTVTLPFTDDFETGVANPAFSFITNPESNVMVRAGAANNSLFGLALEGRSATNYITPNATNVWTTNPEHFAAAKFCVDLTSAAGAELVYDLQQGYNYNDFYTNFRITVNGTQVGPTHRPSGATTPWQTITESLNAYVGQVVEVALESMVKYDSITDNNYNYVDNVIVRLPLSDDISISEILHPVDGCGLPTNDSVVVEILNVGSSQACNFPITFVLNNGTPVTETYNGCLNPGDTLVYTFLDSVDLSTAGSYSLTTYTSLTGDLDNSNDTVSATIESIPVISTLPYLEGFESGQGGWVTYGANTSWAHGTPAGTFITSAASGNNAWVTNLTGDYNNSELSYIESPCMDFSSLTSDPVLYFDHIYNTESCCDEGWVEFSTDAGATWTKLVDNGNAQEWYNDGFNQWWDGNSSAGSANWVNASNVLSGLAGVPDVKIRFVFQSDGSVTNDGFGVDNINIIEQPSVDLGAYALIRPTSACGLTAADTIEVSIFNNGLNTENNVPIIIVINDTLTITDTLASINVGDTVALTFDSLINMSNTGNYSFRIYTSVNNDGNPRNDTILANVTHIPTVSSYPYNEDFEGGNGSWTTYGANSSWAHGTPNAPFITNAAGGNNAWVTNLTGDYNNSELSYLESPCMDFSSLSSDPLLNFDFIYNTESCCDEGWVEYSIDAGATWTKLLDNGNALEWYNDITNQWWDGNSSAGVGNWVSAQDTLVGLAGEPDVKIRFVFQSDGSVTNDGFGVDNIFILEPPSIDIAVTELITPTTQCGFSLTGDTVKVKVKNFGINTVDTIPLGYIVDGGTPVIDTSFTTLAPGDSLIFTFSTTATLGSPGSYSFELFSDVQNDGNFLNDSLNADVLNSQMLVPTTVNFDDLATQQTDSFENDWVGTYSSANYQWYSNIGGTISGSTGPDSDNTTGNGTFMYTEASSPAAQGDTAWLTSPCIDLSNSIDPALVFWYHMYGADIDTLSVQIDSMGTWVTIDTLIGQKQSASTDPYLSDTISLVNFNSLTNTNIRFQMVRGADYYGDVAIDDVELASIPVGLKHKQQKVDFSHEVVVYPNPTNNHINIEFNQAPKNNVELELINMVGKTVYQSETRKNIERIDMSGFAKGVYLLRMTNKEQTAVKRIVLQ